MIIDLRQWVRKIGRAVVWAGIPACREAPSVTQGWQLAQEGSRGKSELGWFLLAPRGRLSLPLPRSNRHGWEGLELGQGRAVTRHGGLEMQGTSGGYL